MEITLSYNPFDKKFRIYRGQNLITETTQYNIAYDTYVLYINRADRVVNKIEKTFNEMWDLELMVAEGGN